MQAMATDKTSRKLTDKLQENIPALMEMNHVPGLSLALIRDAEIFWVGSFGVQSSITREAVSEETVFEVASLSKPVFAYAALKLHETGVLDLDTPLADYLPDAYIPNEPRMKLLCMRHVLSHTTGFPNWRPDGKPLQLYFSPGERFSYSGEGYMYLQTVVAHITGQEPAGYIRSNLLQSLGMTSSRFLWNGDEELPTAVGHDEKGEAADKGLWQEMYAAASLHCTPKDFARFMCAVMNPSSENPAHLSPEMTKEMLTPQVQVNDSAPWDEGWPKPTIKNNDLVSWGLGWGIQHTSDGDSIWHWGDNGNYRAFAVGYPEKGQGIVIMTNGKNGQKVINHILRDIVGGDYPGLDWLYG
jgi:CubicO group peptidase (beta-lactamase class C family)